MRKIGQCLLCRIGNAETVVTLEMAHRKKNPLLIYSSNFLIHRNVELKLQ